MKTNRFTYYVVATATILSALVAAPTAQARHSSNTKALAVSFLKSVQPKMTLAQIKRRLPAGIRFDKTDRLPVSNQGVWTVFPFHGRLNGQLVFYRTSPKEHWAPSDPIHEIDINPEPNSEHWSARRVKSVTKQDVAALLI